MIDTVKRWLQPVHHPAAGSAAMLLIRLVAGCAFIIHGWQKMQHPFGWMGPQSPVPALFQFLAAFSEFGGGIAWVIGLLVPLASLGIGFTMTVAIAMHSMVLHDPFVSLTGGRSYELASAYLCTAVLLLLIGPGKFSLDAKLFGERQ
jgi:putative oxidoreductase